MQQNDHEVVEAPIVELPKKRGFQPGHARMGGRAAGIPSKRQLFDDICAKHKFSAVEFVVQCVKNGATPATPDKPSLPISQSDRCRMAETLLSFAAPRLSATTTEISGKIAVATVDMVELMRNPELARACQTVALGLSTAQRDAFRGDSPKQLENGEDQ
jgi:hypothetical protein